ncbi:MAG: ParB/RepB/Spo0J family partition protein [Pseudomonadota bacterium]|nr:ParB/RepB/Spo0J family partition protein [Pseudomonadota bacterium]
MTDEPARLLAPVPANDPVTPPAKRKFQGLGRGLEALLGESRREESLIKSAPGEVSPPTAANGSGLALLAVSAIEPHPDQPRRHFDEEALAELAASISSRGVIQPVIVRPMPGSVGRYQLVAGERRWRAAQRAQIHEIPAIIRSLSDREVMALALIENLQREDLNAIEEAHAYHRLAEGEGMSQAEIARMVDKSRSHIANHQRLLSLPEPVIALVEQGRLSMGHARALIGAPDAAALAEAAVVRQMSVREVEQLVRRRSRETAPPRRARVERQSGDAADIAAVQNHLEEFLGLSVKIQIDADPRSGAVTIRYRTLDQLDLICQRLTGGGI